MNINISHSSGTISNAVTTPGNEGLRIVVGNLDFDSSYPSGGEAFDVSNYIPGEIKEVIIPSRGGYNFEYDKDNKKVLVKTPATLIHVPFPGLLAPTASATKYLGMNGAEAATAAAAAPFVVLQTGIVKGIYVNVGTAPGEGKTITVTVVKGGTDTSLVATVTGIGHTGSDFAVAHGFAVTKGDLITLKIVKDNGSAAVLGASLLFEASTAEIPTGTNLSTCEGIPFAVLGSN